MTDSPSNSLMKNLGFALLLALMCGGPIWWFLSSNKSWTERQVEREARDKEEKRVRQDRRNHFAATAGAVWVDLGEVKPTVPLLAVDVQRRLQPGSPVAFEIWETDVRAEGSNLILSGEVFLSSVPLEVDLTMDAQWLDTVRRVRPGLLLVAARIEGVTSRKELSMHSESVREATVYLARGRALIVGPSR